MQVSGSVLFIFQRLLRQGLLQKILVRVVEFAGQRRYIVAWDEECRQVEKIHKHFVAVTEIYEIFNVNHLS